MGKKGGQKAAAPNTFKYGMPVYGLVWPEGNTFYICGGGGHGIKNRHVVARTSLSEPSSNRVPSDTLRI